MFNANQPEIKFALEAVRQASQLVRQVQAELVSATPTAATLKEDRSPVTVADFASQALVGHLLSEAFPGDPLVAEEDSGTLRDSAAAHTLEQVTRFVRSFVPEAQHGAPASAETVCRWIDYGQADVARRFWTLDPIDGTKGFLRGDQYVVALALIVDGEVQIGILGCPNLHNLLQQKATRNTGSLVAAVRGQGTWAKPLDGGGDFERLHVSAQVDPARARLLRSFESGHTNANQVDAFARALNIQAKPLLMDSQAKYALLAAGQGELLLRLLSPDKPDYREKIWDQAAGMLVLEEAGGRLTDLHGQRLNFTTGRTLAHNRGILASNNLLHAPALQALKEIGAV
jgi:HAL2 family 3'(2'),5'-bisphosphate nucleotidase